ncbi:MAG: ankyrin repeat domain-containing protein [Alphaproteobacteria bacterium]|nr:ankyrin repeat domain-containing protein [Alphaproteobacteria bacterium]
MKIGLAHLLRVLLLAVALSVATGEVRAQLSLPDTEFLDDIKNGRKDKVASSLVRGQSPNTSNSQSQTALMFAALGGHIDIIDLLVQNKGNVRLKDREGRTALFWAAGNNQADAAERLLKLGAPINDIDRQGTTALMIAARRGYEEVVRVLLAAKADVNLTDHTGRTALMWSTETRNAHVPQLLKQAGAR